MSRVGKTLVKGHGLRAEGAPLHLSGCSQQPCPTGYMGRLGSGHGKCSCGAYSLHLQSTYARKAWHRAHKAEIAAKEPS
jgi:hypothetical protein